MKVTIPIAVILMSHLCLAGNVPSIDDLISDIAKGTVGVRIRAIDAVGKMGPDGSKAVGELTACLQITEPLAIRTHAMKTLGLVGDVRALPVIQWVLANNIEKAASVKSLGKQSLAAIIVAQVTTIDAKGKSGDKDMVEELLKFAMPEYPEEMRIHAIKSLGLIANFEALPLMKEMAARDANPNIRAEAKRSVASLESLAVSSQQKDWLRFSRSFAVVGGNVIRLPKDCGFLVAGEELGNPIEIKLGWLGRIMFPRIVQILPDKEMLLDTSLGVDGLQNSIVKVTGFSTEGLTDGGKIWRGDAISANPGEGCVGIDVAIIGTTTYATVNGASKTVFLGIPLAVARRGLTFARYQEIMKANPKVFADEK